MLKVKKINIDSTTKDRGLFMPSNDYKKEIPLFVRKRPAEKLRAVERALGVSRSILIEWLLHKQGLVDLEAIHKDSPDIEILESAKDNPNVKTMIKNNLKIK